MSEETSSKKLESMPLQAEANQTSETVIMDKIFSGEITSQELEEIPPEVLKRELSSFTTEICHSGPLPAPWILREYENTIPGSAERILRSAEKEQEHRFDMDFRCQETDSRDSKMGIISATLLGLGTVAGGVVMAVVAPGTAGVIVGGLLGASGLAAIVGTFIKGTKATWKINSENNNQCSDQDANG